MAISTSQGGSDPNAIHDDTASEISAVTEKAAPVAADLVLIEDSAAGNVKKRVQLGNLALTDIGARVYNNAALEIQNNTGTTLTFNSERWDTDGIHSTVSNTSRLTCVTAGKYVISAHVFWEANAVGYRLTGIYLNGSTYLVIGHVDAEDPAGQNSNVVITIYDLDVDDYVEVRVLQDSGDVLDVVVNADYSPEFMMQLIAKA